MGGTRKLFTEEQESFYREHCRDLTYQQQIDLMYQTFGISITKAQCKAWRTNHKFFGSLTGRWEKGEPAWNKGKHWDDFMSPEAQRGSRKTCFKKGIVPKNSKPVGCIKMRGDGYLWIKIRNGQARENWAQLHRYIWEQSNGPIPKGKKLAFLDGNTTNCSLDNLMLISEGDLLIANTKYGLIDDPDINRAILETAKLNSALGAAKKRKEKGWKAELTKSSG